MRAAVTATFHGSKIGLHVNPGKAHAGRVEVVDIGIPRGAPGAGARRADRPSACSTSYPRRERERLEVQLRRGGGRGRLGGADRRAHDGRALGAARRGRLRAGGRAGAGAAGRRPAAAGADEPRAAGRRRLPHAAGVADVEEMAERAGAVVLGPGLGRAEGAQEFARGVAARGRGAAARGRRRPERPRRAARAVPRARRRRPCSRPHEARARAAARAASRTRSAAHRLEHVREAAERSGAVVAAEGRRHDRRAARAARSRSARGGTPALATAGTGDVLSGLIGALLAKGLDPFEAAVARRARSRARGPRGRRAASAPTT